MQFEQTSFQTESNVMKQEQLSNEHLQESKLLQRQLFEQLKQQDAHQQTNQEQKDHDCVCQILETENRSQYFQQW